MRMNSWQRRDISKALIAAPIAVTGSSYVVEAADTFIQQLHAHDQSEDIPIHGKRRSRQWGMTAIYGAADRLNNNAAFILPVNYQSGARVPAGQRQRRAQTLNSSLAIRAFPYRKRPHNLQMKNQFREALTGLSCKFVHNLRVSQ